MPRPVKCRRIQSKPQTVFFKPAGVPLREMETVTLTVDEFEAVRLADLEGNYQEEAAANMNVSRQTFGNILKSAHHKIADCLVNAKAISIEGGVFEMSEQRDFVCDACGHQWNLPFGTGRPAACPECGSADIHRRSAGCRARGKRGRRNRNMNRGARG